jgi:hypothetical protein
MEFNFMFITTSAVVRLTTVSVKVLGENEYKTIIPALPVGLSPKVTQKSYDDVRDIDADKALECIMHFANPDAFWAEGYELTDLNGTVIAPGTADVRVFCPTADTTMLLYKKQQFEYVMMHEYESVQEYAQAVGNTARLAKPISTATQTRIAAEASKDEVLVATVEVMDTCKVTQQCAMHMLGVESPKTTISRSDGTIYEKSEAGWIKHLMSGTYKADKPTKTLTTGDVTKYYDILKGAFSAQTMKSREAWELVAGIVRENPSITPADMLAAVPHDEDNILAEEARRKAEKARRAAENKAAREALKARQKAELEALKEVQKSTRRSSVG